MQFILIVDEVLSVGDMAFQLKCFKKFEEFKQKGKTILFVTHSVSDVLKNCNKTIIIDSGRKIFDGGVKEGVERYKKIIVGIKNDDKKQDKKEEELEKKNKKENKLKKAKSGDLWKKHFTENPNIIEYGNKQAEVIDYGIFDENNNYLQTIENDKEIILKSKIEFYDNIKSPIFTMTVKDFQGNDICGTNTLIEKIDTGEYKKGDKVEVEFKQKLPLTPGKYTLSFSCTHFNEKGELEVLSRKYDALLIEVMSTKDTVGLIKLDSKINVNKVEK